MANTGAKTTRTKRAAHVSIRAGDDVEFPQAADSQPFHLRHLGDQDVCAFAFRQVHGRELNCYMAGLGLNNPFTDSRLSTRSEEHTSELQSPMDLVSRLLLEKHPSVRAQTPFWYRADKNGEPQHQILPALFFFNDTATTEIYTLSLHDALPIYILGSFDAYLEEELKCGRTFPRP